jgi:flagellar biosynthesis protein FlhA
VAVEAAQNNANPILERLKSVSDSDAVLGIGIVVILAVMLLPLPARFLDILLVLNITFSLIILLTSVYTLRPLDFSIFPSLLLMTTLFRLSLNIASTRLILLHGHEGTTAAGHVIHAFGYFVVGGNYLVGLVIFIILVIVNFIVITKGTERISEVAARFTLDGMPGKQMAIDADLNAGMINEKEALQRRSQITQEADFYGTMDGASKFVRGDAIACILITFINILGGLGIGVLQNQMNLVEALQVYTLLTVGEGLVAQIPALVISTAAGMLVSRTASDLGIGKAFSLQLGLQAKPMLIVSVMLMLLALIPGFPGFPFFTVSIALGSISFYLMKRERETKAEIELTTTGPEAEKELSELPPPLDVLELELGYGLIPLVDENQRGDLLGRIKAIRHQLALEFGIIVPAMHVRDNLQLKPSEYRLLLKGNPVAKGELLTGYLLALSPGDSRQEIGGIPTVDPAFGLPAVWIPESKQQQAAQAGYTVVDLSTVVATHLTELFKKHADELLTRQTVLQLLENLGESQQKLVDELTPTLLSLGTVQKVLQNLIRERVSLRDLQTICETLVDCGIMTKDPEILTEYVRQALARTITRPYEADNGLLCVLTLHQELEERISKGIQKSDQGSFLSLEPGFVQRFIQAANREVKRVLNLGHQPVILTSPLVRRHAKKLLERFLPEVAVIAHSELSSPLEIKSVGMIGVHHAD